MNISDFRREENYQEYLRLKNDPNYYDVIFDDKSGGVSAIHKEHSFDSKVGAFGVKRGDYEKNALTQLRGGGHVIILESEIAPEGVKTPDGLLDDISMDIKAVEGFGKWSIKDKFHRSAKQGVECVVLYFYDKDLYSTERVTDGWQRYINDSMQRKYNNTIKRWYALLNKK